MQVFLTIDVEIWCNGWRDLDSVFPGSFDRYVYGASPHGNYALPQVLSILNRHGLKAVFFVEPLFAARFGTHYLEIIVALIRNAGQEVQLHLHPEWTDESLVPILENCTKKRQHLSYYTLDEQTALIACGKKMLERAGSGPISAFRSGSYAANRDTFEALRHNDIFLDSSLNRCYAVSAPDLRGEHDFNSAFELHGVMTLPVTVLQDGFGNERPAQVGACSFDEMRDALVSACQAGRSSFVMVSHNFEMLRSGASTPDWFVVRRFENLCAFLADNSAHFDVRGFGSGMHFKQQDAVGMPLPSARWTSTARRLAEQTMRRLRH